MYVSKVAYLIFKVARQYTGGRIRNAPLDAYRVQHIFKMATRTQGSVKELSDKACSRSN